MSWGLDTFSPDVMEPCSYKFLILVQSGHDAVKIMRLCMDPKKVFSTRKFLRCLTQPGSVIQRDRKNYKFVVVFTCIFKRMSTNHNLKTKKLRRTL